jgi:hypothetical protein
LARKRDVEEQVHVVRHAELVPKDVVETTMRAREGSSDEGLLDEGAQLVHGHLGCVHDDVRRARTSSSIAARCRSDCRSERSPASGMRPRGLGEAADQAFFRGVQEDRSACPAPSPSGARGSRETGPAKSGLRTSEDDADDRVAETRERSGWTSSSGRLSTQKYPMSSRHLLT